MHPRAIFVGNRTNFFQWINCASICCTCSCNHTSHNLAFSLKVSHGFLKCIHVHACICIYRNSHDRLEAHAHHRHVLLHREMCIFRTNDFNVTHCFRRNSITLNRPRITVFVFPVFSNTCITSKQNAHQVRLCAARGEYTCLTYTVTHFLAKPVN